MPKVFRQITNWSAWGEDEGLLNDDAPADVLNSFKTNSSRLSIYLVEGQEELNRTLAAFAAARDNVQTLDYLLLDLSTIEELGLQLDAGVQGTLADADVNLRHRDIIALTVDKVGRLAKASHKHGVTERMLDKRIGKLINRAIQESRLDQSKLKPKLLAQLREEKYKPEGTA